MSTVGSLAVAITADINGLTQGLASAQSSVSASGKRMMAIGASLTGAMLTPVVAVGAGAAQVAAQTNQAANQMAASLGLPIEAAEEFAAVAQRVYGNNFTDSVTTAGSAVAEVAKQMELAADSPALQTITEQALMLEDSFGVGVQESVATANQLMQDFGLTSTEAFDFITAGYQRGLDSSGDFLDSVSEYSTQFANAGSDAGQFFSVMESGMQAGMLGTDKAADMFKEFQVRILDGSDATAGGLEMIGHSAAAMEEAINSGAITSADAFQIILNDLAEVEDKSVQMQAGVALFGTQFEDMGMQAALGVNMAGTSMEDLAGATATLEAQYAGFGDRFAAMWRTVTVAAAPLFETLLAGAEEAMPAIEAAVSALIPMIAEMATGIGPLIERVSAWISGFAQMDSGTRRVVLVVTGLVAALAPVATVIGTVITVASAAAPVFGALAGALGLLLSPVGLVVGAVAGLVAILFDVGGAGTWAKEKLEAMGLDGLATALGTAQAAAAGLVETVKGLISGEISFGDILPPQWLSDLMFWTWPELGVPAWITKLFNWTWPLLGPIGWIVKLTSWAWPKLSQPRWLSDLLNFKWPSMPSLPGWMGGGRGEEPENRAAGGPVRAGQLTWVGEEGPELVRWGASATVIPADLSAAMAGGGVTINVQATVASEIDEYRLARRLAEIVRRGGA